MWPTYKAPVQYPNTLYNKHCVMVFRFTGVTEDSVGSQLDNWASAGEIVRGDFQSTGPEPTIPAQLAKNATFYSIDRSLPVRSKILHQGVIWLITGVQFFEDSVGFKAHHAEYILEVTESRV